MFRSECKIVFFGPPKIYIYINFFHVDYVNVETQLFHKPILQKFRFSFSKSSSCKPFDLILIHSNIWGPSQTITMGYSSYFSFLLGVYTPYAKSAPVSKKLLNLCYNA